ncbi:MAG: cadmium-translocating P-type ATPase [Calditrichaeota bacterium]|nr:MAG: cadmium-translocating P-type ATPase [Calditrichota bacterium]
MSQIRQAEFRICGLDCAECAAHLENALRNIRGVESASLDFMTARLQVRFRETDCSLETIEKTIRASGYSVEPPTGRQVTTLFIPGLDCPEEARPIEAALKKLPGVHRVQFHLLEHTVTVEHSVPRSTIEETLKNIGFPPEAARPSGKTSPASPGQGRQALLRVLVTGGLALIGLLLHLIGSPEWLTIPLLVAAMIIGGYPIARKGLLEARNRSLGMNFLMTIAVIGAVSIGEWEEAAMVVFLFSLAQWLEARSMDRARRSIQSLMELSPEIATVKRDSGEQSVPVGEVKVGDIIIIKPGESIPLDGVVVAGESRVDQSPITGESFPLKKAPGDTVYAGSINQRGTLEVRVTHPYQDTTLARIIHLVEEAQFQKAPVQQFVERFARYYTPAVVLLSVLLATAPPLLLGAAFETWFYRALVLLVISCPCALVISTPVTIVSGLTHGARQGILIKGGAYLENFHRVRVIALDKTGTITEGRPRVDQIVPVNHHSRRELLEIAASVESRSEHPLAAAILERAAAEGIAPTPIQEFEALTGRGVKARVNGDVFYLGNHRLFEENGWCDEEIHPHLQRFEDRNHTAVIIGNSRRILGVISVADAPRPEARDAIQQLHRSGVEKTIMLTGDNRATAEVIARELGIDEVQAELLPEDKVATVRALRERHAPVAMVGDGINDAPALAAADIGISLGSAGTDTALETADIVIMNDDLRKLPYLKRLSRRTVRIVRENILIALGLKALFMALAIPGLATLWMAVFADMGASLLVVFNGLRLLGEVPDSSPINRQ